MTKPRISVIMSTYNNSAHLNDAIAGVLSQTYRNFEFIIINDGSTDDTEQKLRKAVKEDRRILVTKNLRRIGLSQSLNKGLAIAKGEFIARIDSDDEWTDPDKLKKQIDFLDSNNEYGMVGCWCRTIDINGHKLTELQYPVSDREIRNYLMIENCFIHSCVLIRSKVFMQVNGYNRRYKFAQDYDRWLAVGLKAKFYNLPDYMVNYRKSPHGMSRSNYKKQIAETIQIIKFYSQKYPNSAIGLYLWHTRLFIPLPIREMLSSLFRKGLFRQTIKK